MDDLVRDHLYDAGWPRDDSQGCIADWPSIAPGGVSDPCGKPLIQHALSEYGDGMDEGERSPGDMHEPPPYRGDLDWRNDGSELLHPFID